MFARLQLARLQEEIYRALYSSESFPLSTNQTRAAVCRIEEGLRQWAEAHEDPESSEAIQAIDVQLDFHAARIVAMRSSSDPRHMELVVREARASSLLLCTAVGRDANATPPTPESLPVSLKLGSPSSLRQSESEHASLRIRSLAESYSVPAFFALVTNIIWPMLEDPDRCDVELLQTVSQIFKDLDHRTQTVKTYSQKVSDTFQGLLAIVQVLRPSLFEQQEQFEHQDKQQHYFNLPHQGSQSTPMINIDPTVFSNAAPSMTWPMEFSDTGTPSQPAVNTTTTNPSAFGFPSPLEYDGRNDPYNLTQQISMPSQGHYNNKQGFTSPVSSNNDYHSQPFFSQFPPIAQMLPLDGEQQDVNNHPF